MSEQSNPTGLVWEDPPVARTSSTVWTPIADALRARPGQWAMVAEDATPGTANNISSGGIKAFRDGDFEASARSIEGRPGRAKIYARYVGPGTPTRRSDD